MQKHALDDAAVLRLMADIARAVAAAHRLGVIHRDLKPSNIVVTDAGVPKVLDFGLAKPVSVSGSELVSLEGSVVGTPRYMSPEQADGRPGAIDTRTDVFALGVIAYRLLTGAFPHEVGESNSYVSLLREIATQAPRRPRLARPDLDTDIEAILLRALEPDAEQRYPTADALASDLTACLDGRPVQARRATTGYVVRKWVGRNQPLAALLTGLCFAALTATGWAFNRPARIELRSEPDGAVILVDGRVVPSENTNGYVRTNDYVTLSRGSHVIHLVATDRVAERRTINVRWGRAVGEASDPISLRAAHQKVFFTSQPPGATVSLRDPTPGPNSAASPRPMTRA